MTERLNSAYMALVKGWREPVAYSVVIDGDVEDRRRERHQDALITQLEFAVSEQRSKGGSGGGSSNKPATKPPGNPQFADYLDDMYEQAVTLYKCTAGIPDELQMAGDVRDTLRALFSWCQGRSEDYATQVKSVETHMCAWVRRARLMLGYDVKEVMLADVSCHVCGGALVVAADASSDVRCVGLPFRDDRAQEPCGHVYPRERWVDFLA